MNFFIIFPIAESSARIWTHNYAIAVKPQRHLQSQFTFNFWVLSFSALPSFETLKSELARMDADSRRRRRVLNCSFCKNVSLKDSKIVIKTLELLNSTSRGKHENKLNVVITLSLVKHSIEDNVQKMIFGLKSCTHHYLLLCNNKQFFLQFVTYFDYYNFFKTQWIVLSLTNEGVCV